MVHRHGTRRLTSFLALGFVVIGGLIMANPAAAQQPGGRFRVLVPDLERQGNVSEKFGRQVADEVRKLINGLPTHAPVEKGDLNKMLKQYNLKEKDLTCITSRQLAAQSGVELVMCGTYAQADGGMEVSATFIVARDQHTFDVEPFTAANPKEAAAHIFASFESYVNQLRLTAFCHEDLEREDWASALDKCEQALAIGDGNPTALYGKGFALMKMDQLEPALEALEKVLELNPVHQEAILAAGYVTAKLDRKDESRAYYRQYLELNPGSAQVRLTVAIEAAQAGDPENALQIVEQGMQGDSVDLTLVEYAGYFSASSAVAKMVEAGHGQNAGGEQLTPEARAYYEKALDYLGQVFEAKGNESPVNVLVQRLNALTQLGMTQEAVEFGAQAVAAKSDDAGLWRAYAMTLKEAGRLDDALAALDSVLANDPEATNIRALKGQWLIQAGRIDAGATAFRAAVDAGEIASDLVAKTIFSFGYNEKFQKQQQDDALAYFDVAARFATEAETKGMINFFTGYGLYNQGMKVQAPGTAASAKQALPIFQRALDHLRGATAYAETSASIARSLQQLLDGTQQYIEIQEALIKRGR